MARPGHLPAPRETGPDGRSASTAGSLKLMGRGGPTKRPAGYERHEAAAQHGGRGCKDVIAAIKRALGMQRGQLAGRYVPHLYYW